MEKTKNFLKKHNKLIKSIVLALLIAINVVSCIIGSQPREPTTAHAEDNGVYDLEDLAYADPPLYISTNIWISNNITKNVSINVSIDKYGDVYFYVGSNSYLLQEGEFITIPLSVSNYGINSTTTLDFPVKMYQTFSQEFWEEGITSFEYIKQYSSEDCGVHFVLNKTYQLTILLGIEWSSTPGSSSVAITSSPTYTFMYTDEVYRRAYTVGYYAYTTKLSPFQVITDGVSDLLSIEIIGGVELGMMLWLGLGIILFHFVVKLLLGG